MQYTRGPIPARSVLTSTETLPVNTPIVILTAVATRVPGDEIQYHVNEYSVIGLAVEQWQPRFTELWPITPNQMMDDRTLQMLRLAGAIIRYDYVVVHDGRPIPFQQIPHVDKRVRSVLVLPLHLSKDAALGRIAAGRDGVMSAARDLLMQEELANGD
jgi:hypothetical protein